jgi:hypothetical protein
MVSKMNGLWQGREVASSRNPSNSMPSLNKCHEPKLRENVKDGEERKEVEEKEGRQAII